MKEYQNWFSLYLICRRDRDHSMAAELAECISDFWKRRGDCTEQERWHKVYLEHFQKIS